MSRRIIKKHNEYFVASARNAVLLEYNEDSGRLIRAEIVKA